MKDAPLWFFAVSLTCLVVNPAVAREGDALALQQRLNWYEAGTKQAPDDPAASAAGLQRVTAGTGRRLQQYRQQFHGIEVFGARLSVLYDADGRPQASGGSLHDAQTGAALPAFASDATTALGHALAALQTDLRPTSAAKRGDDAYLRWTLPASADWRALRPARVKPVWYPAESGLIAAYYTELLLQRRGAERPEAEALVIAADDGRVLRRQSQLHDLQPFSYRVFAGADGLPYVDAYGYTNPHPTGRADGYRPMLPAPMQLLTLAHGAISTNDPWLADAASETRGNNVDAFFNAELVADGECTGDGWGPQFNAADGDFRATVNGPRRFDYAYDANASLGDYRQCDDATAPVPADDAGLNAKIVQGFYAGNWLHDFFYDLGYDEAAGNAQADNYGRGGIAGDPLLVHAGYWSTFTYAPGDGESPSLSLGVNTFSRSSRDVSAFDFGVLAHEWAHTMFGRLTTSAYYGQPGALNEGTADFVGLLLSVREQDRHARPGEPEFGGAYAVGAYMNLDYDYPPDGLPQAGSPGYPDNSYYHGIRRYPYTISRTRNPLTLRHIGLDQPVPAASAPFDWKARSRLNAEIHSAGEVWTTALWQCSRNVLAAATPAQFATRQRALLGWLVSGLQLFPTDATYTEARDALLLAIRADSEADYRRCRSGFAERGFGAGALAPPRGSYSLRGAQDSFRDTERALSLVELRLREDSGDGDGVLDHGESGTLLVTLRNSGFSALQRIVLVVPPIPGFSELPQAYLDGITLQPGESTQREFPFRVRSNRGGLNLPVQALAWDALHPEAFTVASQSFRVNYDLVRDRYVDSLANEATFAADWIHGFENNPHGCVFNVCTGAQGDALADVLDWQRERHAGSAAYRIGDEYLGLNTWLATRPFTVAAGAPLELLLRHDFDFDRGGSQPGFGRVEIRLDGGAWQDATALLSSGSAQFNGVAGGWRDDTLRFAAGLAGRQAQLRLRLRANGSFAANRAFWALSRIEIRGAATPMFSRVVEVP